jgi:hypothetical protein
VVVHSIPIVVNTKLSIDPSPPFLFWSCTLAMDFASILLFVVDVADNNYSVGSMLVADI